jgi:hypothetical protein
VLSDTVRSMVGRTRKALAPPSAPRERVSFDPQDGKKRVLITVGTDGKFEPVEWYGMTPRIDAYEASVVVAHGALIVAEHLATRRVRESADGN